MTSDELLDVRQKIINLLEESGMQGVKVDMSVGVGCLWLTQTVSNSFKVTMEISGHIDSLFVMDKN